MMKLRLSLLTGAASALLTLATGAAAQAQQNYVGFYDAYVGFADINAPALGLNQPGFHTQLGVNPRSWYSVGFDFSIASGSELLTPELLPANLQALIAGAQQQYTALRPAPARLQAHRSHGRAHRDLRLRPPVHQPTLQARDPLRPSLPGRPA